MPNYKVEVGGTEASKIVEVTFDKSTGASIGAAAITVANTTNNRTLFTSGSEVVVKQEDESNPGTFNPEFTGVVQGTPSVSSKQNAVIEVQAESRMAELEYGKVNRPFIEMDTGAIIREAVNNLVEPDRSPALIHTGSSTSNWESDAPIFELANIDKSGLKEYGSNLLFVGWREGADGDYYIRYNDVPSAAAPDGRILSFETRILVNNDGNVFEGEVELRDNGGNNYVWELDIGGYSGFETYEFAPTDADFDAGELSSDLTLEYRFDIDGALPEDRAIAIDHAQTTPFATSGRDSPLSTTGVEDTGRIISRRIDDSILGMIDALSTEDGAVAFVDDNNVLHYETAGDTQASKEITDDGSTPIVDATFNRDYDRIRNRVVVQGKGGITRTFENSSSIQFYGVSPREEPIIDESLATVDDLSDRGRGFLDDNAWHDTAMTFTIGDASYRSVRVGQSIDVTWADEDVDGSFIITEKKTTPEGYIELTLSGNTTA